METWITADTHFHHRWMAEHRQWDSVRDHDLNLEDVWNTTVGVKDEVWHLGDFSFGNREYTEALFGRLHGRKHLVVGNHDPNRVQKLGWETVEHIQRRKFAGVSYVMCHYPMLTWPNAHHGTRHLHGHSHGNLMNPTNTTRIDVGYDVHGRFLNVDDLDDMFMGLTYDKVDHHGD